MEAYFWRSWVGTHPASPWHVINDVLGRGGDASSVADPALKSSTILAQTTNRGVFTYSGVQYVHWVMHKCIMVKVRGNEIHIKYVKSRVTFLNRGEICESRGK